MTSTSTSTNTGSTALAYLPEIFAAADGLPKADAAELKHLTDIAAQAGDYVCDIIRTLGGLMSAVDPVAMENSTVIQLGWVLRGLCELRDAIECVRSRAAYQSAQRANPLANPR